jgi:probable rRNA maturation factor
LNKATDVLSFGMKNDPDILGDIVISVPQARLNASRYNNSLLDELAYLAIHGICHLQGHGHHSTQALIKMQQAENQLIKKLALKIKGRI